MDAVIVWMTALAVTAGTYLMRIAGSLPGFRRLARAQWVRHVPLAVFFVLAAYAIAPASGGIPAPSALISAGLVLVLSLLRTPLSLRIVFGTAVYGALTTFVYS